MIARSPSRAPLRAGVVVALVYVALSIVPIIQVESQLAFALKIGGLIVVTNLAGVLIYLATRRRSGRT